MVRHAVFTASDFPFPLSVRPPCGGTLRHGHHYFRVLSSGPGTIRRVADRAAVSLRWRDGEYLDRRCVVDPAYRVELTKFVLQVRALPKSCYPSDGGWWFRCPESVAVTCRRDPVRRVSASSKHRRRVSRSVRGRPSGLSIRPVPTSSSSHQRDAVARLDFREAGGCGGSLLWTRAARASLILLHPSGPACVPSILPRSFEGSCCPPGPLGFFPSVLHLYYTHRGLYVQ